MQIERVDETQLTPSDDALINTLLKRSFGGGFGNRSFHQQRHTLRLLLRQDKMVIGHMALCYRAVRLGDILHNIMGLAEVASDPDFRGQGVASRLMTAAIAEAKATQAAFFLLLGDQPLYTGNGFRAASNPITHVDYDQARTGSVHQAVRDQLMVLPLHNTPWDDTATLDLLGHKF
jgi:predicted N-acetyltransferase YhbS